MKHLFKAILPAPIWRALRGARERWFTRYSRESFSQEGEDLILERFLESRATGFYVDIGAHHPKRFSNTYLFYRKGWSGINVDAAPGSMAPFRRLRPRDVNVEAAINIRSEQLTFYVFEEPALNTFDRDLAMRFVDKGHQIIREIELSTVPLSELLERYLPDGTRIDILNVDVEGFDYAVLRSNDWNRYQPEYILAECHGAPTFRDIHSSAIYQLLSSEGYEVVAMTMLTIIFRRMQAPGPSSEGGNVG